MATVFITGFEDGSLNTLDSFSGMTAVTTQKRTGAYSAYASASGHWGNILLPASYGEIYIRFGFRPTGSSGGGGGGPYFLRMSDANFVNHLQFSYATSSGLISVKRPSDTIATSTVPLINNIWNCIEMHIIIDDSTGVVAMKVEGVLGINFSGDTRNYGLASVKVIGLGQGRDPGDYWGLAYGYYDDFVVNDTSGNYNNSWPGLGGVISLPVSGTGDHTGLTPSTGDNYACVDEIPASDTDYVFSDTADVYDLYALDTSAIPAHCTVAAVKWAGRGGISSGTGNITPVIRSESTTEQQSDIAVSTDAALKTLVLSVDPIDTTEWTRDKLLALEAGVAVG